MDIEQKKKRFNIATIGHVDHGKTTLTSAITHVLVKEGLHNKFLDIKDIDTTKEEWGRGITINRTVHEFSSSHWTYQLSDLPGHRDYIKNMIVGTFNLDCAILVVAAESGPDLQTKEHVLIANSIGVENIIVFINKLDLIDYDPEMLQVVEDETWELLISKGYKKDNIKFIAGSALQALKGVKEQENTILKLIQLLDSIKLSSRNNDPKNFLMNIDKSYLISGHGLVVTGSIVSGSVKEGDSVELLTNNTKSIKVVKSIEMFWKKIHSAISGDNVGILLRGLKKEEVGKCTVLSYRGLLKTSNIFDVILYLFKENEGGWREKKKGNKTNAIKKSFESQLFIGGSSAVGVQFVKFENKEIEENPDARLMPGDWYICTIKTKKYISTLVGTKFLLREGKESLGRGKIKKIIELKV